MAELTDEEKERLFFHIFPLGKKKKGGLNNEELIKFSKDTCLEIEATFREYLSYNLFEQIKRVRDDVALWQEKLDISKKKKTDLKIVKILDRILVDLMQEASKIADTQNYINSIEGKIKVLIHSHAVSGQFDAFFRFMFIQALVGNGTHTLDMEYRQKLKAEFGLIQTSNFKNALFEVLNPVFFIPRGDEDTRTFWTINRSLELLAKYNRLSLIIDYVRKSLKKDRKQKKQLQEIFGISDDWISLVDSSQNTKDLALEWAMKLMNVEDALKDFYTSRKSDRKIKKDSSDLNFEHIHNRILKKARRNTPTHNLLVYCTFFGSSRQIGSINPKTDNIALLKVEDWSPQDAYGKSIFFAGTGTKYF